MAESLRSSRNIQSRHERAGDLTLVAGLLLAASLIALFPLQWWQALIVGVLCLAPAAILNRLGWLKVFGPVLYYDIVRQARRGRFIVMRILYCCSLVGVLFVMAWIELPTVRYTTGVDLGTAFAKKYFEFFLALQFGITVVLTPAFVAGAIADERERHTLQFMFATDLLNREIVLSKFGSRLANFSLMVMAGLPILSCLQFLGSVDPNLVVAGFVITALTAVGEAGVSILFSVLCKNARNAIISTYGAGVLYYAVSLLLWEGGITMGTIWSPLSFAGQTTIGDVAAWFINTGNVIYVFQEVRNTAAAGTLAIDLPILVGDYAGFHAFLALVGTGLAIVCLRQPALARMGVGGLLFSKRHVGRRPAVYNSPMIWKELYCEGLVKSTAARCTIYASILAVTIAPLKFVIDRHVSLVGSSFIEPMNQWTHHYNLGVGFLTLVAIGTHAGGSIARERRQGTWESLMTTPLTSSAIFRAKWCGSIFNARWGILWLLLIWTIGIVSGGMRFRDLSIVAAAWLLYATCCASLGLFISASAKSPFRAMAGAFIGTVAVGFGHWLCWLCCLGLVPYLPALTGFPLAEFQGGRSPIPFGFAMVPRWDPNLPRHFQGAGHADYWLGLGLFCLAATSFLLYQFTRWRLRLQRRGAPAIASYRLAYERVSGLGESGGGAKPHG